MNNSSAVSSVVGVMLMLVVTLIVAASVSAFASGVFEVQDKSPHASISVKAITDSDNNETQFEHLGGDSFNINNIYVAFQTGESKTTLSRTSVGDDCLTFELIGDTGDLVKPGSRIRIMGSEPDSGEGIRYGSLVLYDDTIVSWKLFDKTTDSLIATGEMIV